MLSKILISSITLAQSDARDTISKLRNTKHHPFVRDGDCGDAGAAVNRLKSGPANIPALVAGGGTYTDSDFTTPNALFWDGYESTTEEAAFDSGLSDGTYTWQSWKSAYNTSPNALFYDTTNLYLDPNQGGAGTCYFIAAIGAAGEWPDMITDMFVSGTSDSAIGLYGI